MESRWRVELLGQVRAVRGDRVVTRFRSQKAWELIARLALPQPSGRCEPHAVSREELMELLWPETDPEVGRSNLRYVLHLLRRAFEATDLPRDAVLITDRSSVCLNPAVFTVDATEFEAALHTTAQTRDATGRAQSLAVAVGLYQGEFLPGFYDPWVLSRRQAIADLYLGALQQLVAMLEQSGDLEGALAHARRAVAADPLREEAHYDLMRLYAAAGQPSATLRQYQELERLLREELDETPSAATRALADELRDSARTIVVARSTAEVRLVPEPSPDAPTSRRLDTPSPPHSPRLPVQFTRFVGREGEIAQIAAALRIPETRLVTLTGPGGSGKTRLAVAVAGRLQTDFFDRVWFVPLADLVEARLIPNMMISALGLSPAEYREPLEQMVEALQGAPGLLVLDNFEHLVEEGAPLVRQLIERLPSLTCLVTSRQHLGLPGEQEFVVLPLPTPGVQAFRRPGVQEEQPDDLNARTPQCLNALLDYPSVALFVDRAQAARPGFRLTVENAAAVAALCDRLEGLPLAIELAAARARILTPQQMLARLEKRFDLLVSHERGGSARHRSLRAAIEWSYQLLPPPLQRFFARLSVFRGGWTLEAAETVCAEPLALEYLEQLQQGSLVVAEEAGDVMRYRLLETLREFAAEQLGAEERAALARQHALFYLVLAEQMDAHSQGAEGEAQVRQLRSEHDNLRAALDWSLAAGEEDPAAPGPGQKTGVPGQDPGEIGLRLGAALRRFWAKFGYFSEGREYLAQLLRLPRARPPTLLRARAKLAEGHLALHHGDYEAARQACEESLSLAQQVGDPLAVAAALVHMGTLASRRHDDRTARRLLEEALTIYQEKGNSLDIISALMYLAKAASSQEDPTAAAAYLDRTLAISRPLEDKALLSGVLSAIGMLALSQGDSDRARAHLEESLAIQSEPENRLGTFMALCHLSEEALYRGDHQRARQLCRESLQIAQELGNPRDTAWSLRNLGRAALWAEEWEEAGAWFAQSLTIARSLSDLTWFPTNLEGLAQAAAGQADPERAARLLGAAAALRESNGIGMPPAERPEYERGLAAVRAALGEASFATAWAAGRALTLEQAVAEALGTVGPLRTP